MNKDSAHPLGAWYHVASVYDGKEFSNYVNGVRQGARRSPAGAARPGSCVGRRADQQGVLLQGRRSPRAVHAPGALTRGVSRATGKAVISSASISSAGSAESIRCIMNYRQRSCVIVLICLSAVTGGAQGRRDPPSPLLGILRAELRRNLDGLKTEPVPPYYIATRCMTFAERPRRLRLGRSCRVRRTATGPPRST